MTRAGAQQILLSACPVLRRIIAAASSWRCRIILMTGRKTDRRMILRRNMMADNDETKEGISLKAVYIWLIVIAVAISGLVIFSSFHLSKTIQSLSDVTKEHITLEKAAHELMDASDYLTEQVQRFTIAGDRRFMDAYFTEAFETKRREDAISRMGMAPGSEEALNRLKEAMNDSMELMKREYYAMRLVTEAKGYTDYPEVLQDVALSGEDRKLSPEDKMRRATCMVLDDDYYEQKDDIRTSMQKCLDELESLTNTSLSASLENVQKELSIIRIVVVFQILGIVFIVWLASHIGINPILKAVDRIKHDKPIPEVGANEFRYLARVYNRMYDVYKSSLERLNFKASHDELTGAYNRAGYNLLLSSIDLNTTYMLLFDVDNFKSINDTFGHETGDQVLIKLVQILKRSFRADDYICRIGGDEFVVFMVHSSKIQQTLISGKIEQISRELQDAGDGVPAASISVGIVHGSEAEDAENLFKKTDAAMYRSKQNGKNQYTFHEA